MLAGAIAAFLAAFTRVSDSSDDPVVQSGGTSDIVEELLPARGSQVVQQTTVGIDLASGWDGTLLLAGREVPADQLDQVPQLNRITFTPAEGKVLAALPAGRFCVTAVVWESRTGRTAGARNVDWCFEVV
jgi:hypothetical protein